MKHVRSGQKQTDGSEFLFGGNTRMGFSFVVCLVTIGRASSSVGIFAHSNLSYRMFPQFRQFWGKLVPSLSLVSGSHASAETPRPLVVTATTPPSVNLRHGARAFSVGKQLKRFALFSGIRKTEVRFTSLFRRPSFCGFVPVPKERFVL